MTGCTAWQTDKDGIQPLPVLIAGHLAQGTDRSTVEHRSSGSGLGVVLLLYKKETFTLQ